MEKPWHSICPICRHLPSEHGEQGRCRHAACSCVINPRIFLESRPVLSSLAAGRILGRMMEKYPAGFFIHASLVLALLGVGCGWLAKRLGGYPWIGAPLTAVSRTFIVLGFPGSLLGYFYVPDGDRRIGGARADKTLLGVLAAAVVLTVGVLLFSALHR